jgi:hypothetical protein
MLGWLGVRQSTTPYFAFTVYAPPLVLSPLSESGGIDPHELAHLIYLGAPGPRLSPLADEAFATAVGGAFGHSLAWEICDAYGKGDSGTFDARPEVTAKRKALLLLARAMHDALNSGADSLGFFGNGRWTRLGAEWKDLGSLLGVPADSLFQAAQHNLKSEVARCETIRRRGGGYW